MSAQPFSRSWLYGGIRHLNRNVDYEAFWFPAEGEDRDTANLPNVRSDETQADLLAASPVMLDALRKVAAYLDQGRAIVLTAEEAREVRAAIELAEGGK